MASARDCFSPVPTSPFLVCEFCQTQNSFTSGSAQPSACSSGSTFFKCWAFCLSPTTPEWEDQCKTDLFFSPVSIKLCAVIFAWHFHTTGIKHTLLKPACNARLCSSFSYGKFQLQWQSLTALSSPPTLLSPPREGGVFLEYGWRAELILLGSAPVPANDCPAGVKAPALLAGPPSAQSLAIRGPCAYGSTCFSIHHSSQVEFFSPFFVSLKAD